MIARPGGPDWAAREVHTALDLCLSCKGCASDCPTGVDMATWKSEVLYQTYRRHLRPRSHYTLGRLPRWANLAARAPRMTNRLMATRWGGRLARLAAGVDPRRDLPRFAAQTFGQWWRARTAAPDQAGRPGVVLWVDSFTDHFDPQVGRAAVTVLEQAGYTVDAVTGACCGLTWISTGQLGQARRIVRRTVDRLTTSGGANYPIVGLEPSCTAVLRHDATLLLDDETSRTLATRVRTLAEHLTGTPSWQPPDLAGVEVIAQPHCHHHAVLGWSTDADLLGRTGATVTRLGGCCGLAGNWGVERGHHDLSVAIAGQQLLPGIEQAGGATVLADGFSCRTQVAQLTGRRAVHLAELLTDPMP
jgi:Fe-S oxidoreductase